MMEVLVLSNLILIFVCLGLGYAVIHLILLQRKTSRKRDVARAQASNWRLLKHSMILEELDLLFRRRTGLSENLISAALSKEIDDEFHEETSAFLQNGADSMQRILSKVTGSRCAVSIKLFVPDDSYNNGAELKTFFRDAASRKIRNELYNDLEPFNFSKNAFFRKLLEEEPFERFVFSNDLVAMGDAYYNQRVEWKGLFNASAVHLVCDPNSELREGVFGFLCVDNKVGGFDPEVTCATMSIFASTIYYCLTASSALELIQERLVEND